MPDRYLRRPKFYANERAEPADLNRLASAAVNNVAVALHHALLGPGLSGIIRGGDVYQADPPSMQLWCGPTVASAEEGGLIVFESPRQCPLIPANSSGNDRIDRLSLAYNELETSEESRTFITSENSQYENPTTKTEIVSSDPDATAPHPSIVLTVGTPSATPQAPANPEGTIPLALIAVPNGVSALNANHINPSAEGHYQRVQHIYGSYPNGNDPNAVPWTSPEVVLNLPQNLTALFFCSMEIEPKTLGTVAADGITLLNSAVIQLVDMDTDVVISPSGVSPCFARIVNGNGVAVLARVETLVAVPGFDLAGSNTGRRYAMRLTMPDGPDVDWDEVMISRYDLTVVLV